MSLLLSLLGFVAQLCIVLSLGSIAISSLTVSPIESAILPIESPVAIEVIDATLLCTSAVCAKSMTTAFYSIACVEPMTVADDYSAMTIRQLKALCKERRVKGYSSLRKHELVSMLSS